MMHATQKWFSKPLVSTTSLTVLYAVSFCAAAAEAQESTEPEQSPALIAKTAAEASAGQETEAETDASEPDAALDATTGEPAPAQESGAATVPPAAVAPVAAAPEAPAVEATLVSEPPPPPPGYDSLNRPRRPKKGMMIAGWGVFGGGYLLSALVGAMMLSGDATNPGEVCTNCTDVGPKLMIPIVGPFLAIPGADGTDGKVVSTLLGLMQVTGLTLGIVGTIRYIKGKRAYQSAIQTGALPEVRFGYAGAAEGGHLTLGWRF